VPPPEKMTEIVTCFVFAGTSPLVSCTLARVEVVRAVRAHGPRPVRTARELLAEMDLVELDDELLDIAGELEPPHRSLDAIHLAAALELGDELEAVITYDGRMARAAEALGLPVAMPV
jgi:predicted nucleic acid-binding protein